MIGANELIERAKMPDSKYDETSYFESGSPEG